MKRGEIYYADLGIGVGSEQNGKRPVLIVQNEMGNYYSSTVVVAVITTRPKKQMPTHIQVGKVGELKYESYVLLEQLRTIDKIRLEKFLGSLEKEQIKRIDYALKVCMQLI